MPKTLIIAEKPSVMNDLSRALAGPLGKFQKEGTGRDVFYENDNAIITSAVGHLVELRMPMGPNGRKLPWNFDVLPAIPEHFDLDPIPDSEPRLRQVLKLAKRKDVDRIVNACDAGREGELIFRYIMEIGEIKKPVERLWMQSMTQNSIIQAWNSLRPEEEMKPLADAAKCRSESDWLVGLNATRALTCFNSRHGGFNITAAGRVQTPTLAILANRESEILSFIPAAYHEVHAVFGAIAGTYPGRWIDPDWKKDPENPHARAERIWDGALATAIRQRCEGTSGTVSEDKKLQNQIPPQLYDLTTLQREAPFSAKGTLQIAQALYEKHKAITYPRTDSRYLPEDYFDDVRDTLRAIAASTHDAADHARAVLDGRQEGGPRLVKSRRVFDTKKVSDHFAIIPTGTIARLSDTEQKLYDMIVRRFIAVFFPPAEFEQTTRLTRIAHAQDLTDVFRTDGRILVKPGYLAVYGRKPGVAKDKDELVPVTKNESVSVDEIEVRDEMTKPPARFSESTLLSAMEGAGKLIEDEALREAMSERGLGTPATRANIIEGLIAQKYLLRDGRELHVTPTGMRLIALLHEMKIEGLYSPKLTGDWEQKLHLMEQGSLKREEFMREIVSYTNEIVSKAVQRAEEIRNQPYDDLKATCPKCGAENFRQTDATFECRGPDCGFKLKKHIAGRPLSESEAAELLAKKFIGPLTGFRSKFNKPFDAALELDEKYKVNFVFDNEDPDADIELTEDMVIGNASDPKGQAVKIYATEKSFLVPEWKTKNDPKGLRIGRAILQKEIPPEQAVKLLTEGRTDLLKGFISNRTKRGFDAHLTLDPATGKVGFDFPPRPERPGKKPAAAGGSSDEVKPAKKRVAKKAARKSSAKKSTARKSPVRKSTS